MFNVTGHIKGCDYGYYEVVTKFLQEVNNNGKRFSEKWETLIDEDNEYYYRLDGTFEIPNSNLSIKYWAIRDENDEHYSIGATMCLNNHPVDEEDCSWSDGNGFSMGARYYWLLVLKRWFNTYDLIEGLRDYDLENLDK